MRSASGSSEPNARMSPRRLAKISVLSRAPSRVLPSKRGSNGFAGSAACEVGSASAAHATAAAKATADAVCAQRRWIRINPREIGVGRW